MNNPAWQQDNQRIARFYSGLVAQHGLAPSSLDWGSRQSQERRFGVLTGIAPLDGHSLLDVGCGLADLWDYLQRRGAAVNYTGYDITPSMIERASRRFPGLKLAVKNLLEEPATAPAFDYIIASGIFYLRQSEPLAFMEMMIRRMFARCHRGVAFNSLSARAAQRDPGEFYADPEQVLRLCLDITPYVALRHDYLPHDFTIWMYREPNQPA